MSSRVAISIKEDNMINTKLTIIFSNIFADTLNRLLQLIQKSWPPFEQK